MSSSAITPITAKDEHDLVLQLSTDDSDKVVATILKTDERVLARVTDGIYRQPGSALRELISNAYDADATRVVIKTDAPRFDRISIEDNGHGMSLAALARMLHHIGGSAKRHAVGGDLGITDPEDSLRSPGGRRLIGKIGIGLFSVSQLTRTFQIITKVKGEHYRTVATVALRQYSENGDQLENDSEFESGKVNVWREKATDVESHGTSVYLTGIRPQARDTLRSREIWSSIEESEKNPEETAKIEPPRFHIGRVDSSSGEFLKPFNNQLDSIPWDKNDSPEKAFTKLVDAVWNESKQGNPNPRLERIFDYYLQMVWQLALAAPLPYIDGNLFDLDLTASADVFQLSNRPRGAAEEVSLEEGQTIRESLELSNLDNSSASFEVFFDDLKLFRPIKFRSLPTTSHALKKPLVFIGKCREEFSRAPRELSGGPLSFEAYLFWNPKIAPTEHRGSLIRIHGSSGTLFDPTFMRYQVSEQTRLSQITCEIFVHEGLDSALNIDRESFNYAHPHSVFITKWLHSALRQLATAQKKLASEVRFQEKEEARDTILNEIQKVAKEVWIRETGDLASRPPSIVLTKANEQPADHYDAYLFSRNAIFPNEIAKSSKSRQELLEEKIKAIAQVLASFGIFDDITKEKQEQLLKAIYQIISATED